MAARVQAGIGQAELARRCGVSRAYLYQIEHGARPCPQDILSAYQSLLKEAPPETVNK